MGEAARAAGIGHEIELRGRKFRVSEKTPEWVGLMEMWLQSQAWDALERMRGIWTVPVFNERSDRLLAEITAGAYSWGSVAMARAMSHLAGMKEGMYLAIVGNLDQDTSPQQLREMLEEFWEQHEKKAIEAWMRANPPDPRMAPAAGQDSA